MPYRVSIGRYDATHGSFTRALEDAGKRAMAAPGQLVEVYDVQSKLLLRRMWYDREKGFLQTISY